jgi:hypothetical protein
MEIVVVVADGRYQIDAGVDDHRFALTRDLLLGDDGAQQLRAGVDDGAPRLEHQQRSAAEDFPGALEAVEDRFRIRKPEVAPAHASAR